MPAVTCIRSIRCDRHRARPADPARRAFSPCDDQRVCRKAFEPCAPPQPPVCDGKVSVGERERSHAKLASIDRQILLAVERAELLGWLCRSANVLSANEQKMRHRCRQSIGGIQPEKPGREQRQGKFFVCRARSCRANAARTGGDNMHRIVSFFGGHLIHADRNAIERRRYCGE